MALPHRNMRDGTVIDGLFQLERQLGAGGMGTVWVAQDLRLGRSVAIKFLNADAFDDEHARQRFEREARMAGKIRSPHVVQVFAQGITSDGISYVVMELLDGEDLASRLARQGPLSLPEASGIVEQVCRGLSRAHREGLVHRDIKPHNIFLVSEPGEQVFAKLLDFGIAKDMTAQVTALTLTGAVMGSVLYMSPEQLRDAQSVGPAADIWALGVVIYQMLTGQVPFDSQSLPELLVRIADGRFTEASSLNPALPRAIDGFLSRAITPDLSQRYASAEELSSAFLRLVRANTSGVVVKPGGAGAQSQPPATPAAVASADADRPFAQPINAAAPTQGRVAGRGFWIAVAVVVLAGAATLALWPRSSPAAGADPQPAPFVARPAPVAAPDDAPDAVPASAQLTAASALPPPAAAPPAEGSSQLSERQASDNATLAPAAKPVARRAKVVAPAPPATRVNVSPAQPAARTPTLRNYGF